MIGTIAWSDLITHEQIRSGGVGGRGKVRVGIPFCAVDGCGLNGLGGAGYCDTHARNFYRTGHPLGMLVRASLRAMLDAARAFGSGGRPATYPPRGSVRELIRAARRYAEADTDSQYARARNRLEAAAVEWVRGKVRAHRNKEWRERRNARLNREAA